MSAFKRMVASDRRQTFLNADFFGEEYRIEGKLITIVLDDDGLKEKQGGQDLAVAESDTLFYAAVEDLPPRRAPGENLNINGREYVVDDWTEDMGIAAVALHRTITG